MVRPHSCRRRDLVAPRRPAELVREAGLLGARDLVQRRIERRDRLREAAAIAPGRAVRDERGVLDRRDLDELLRDQRPAERGRHRIARIRQRAGLERRQHAVARELLARVEHVRARWRRRRARDRGSRRGRPTARGRA